MYESTILRFLKIQAAYLETYANANNPRFAKKRSSVLTDEIKCRQAKRKNTRTPATEYFDLTFGAHPSCGKSVTVVSSSSTTVLGF